MKKREGKIRKEFQKSFTRDMFLLIFVINMRVVTKHRSYHTAVTLSLFVVAGELDPAIMVINNFTQGSKT